MLNWLRRNGAHTEDVQDHLQRELAELRREMESVESCYDLAQDEDLIESLIYQHNALQARHTYLMKQAKREGVTSNRIRISV